MKMILDSHWLIHYFLGESMGNIFFFGCRKSANPSGGWDEYLPPRLSPGSCSSQGRLEEAKKINSSLSACGALGILCILGHLGTSWNRMESMSKNSGLKIFISSPYLPYFTMYVSRAFLFPLADFVRSRFIDSAVFEGCQLMPNYVSLE